MNFLARFRIGPKLIGSFVTILSVLALLGYLSNLSLSRVNADMSRIVSVDHPASLEALQLAAQLKEASRALGFYLVTQDDKERNLYEQAMIRLQAMAEQLAASPAIRGDEILRQQVERIRAEIDTSQKMQAHLVEVASDPNSNLPAMKYAAEHVNPPYRTRLQLLGSMIDAEQEEEATAERRALYAAMVKLRYYWVTINNEQRLFLAFRAQSALENAHAYMEAAQSALHEVERLSDLFTFEQEDAFSQFKEGLDQFWSDMEKVFALHAAENWRSDAYLSRTQVLPALARAEEQIGTLVTMLEERGHEAATAAKDLYQSQRTQTLLVVGGAFLLLGLLGWGLSRNITHPLREASRVAARIAEGRLDNRIVTTSRDETGDLLRALEKMQIDLRHRIEADTRVAAENLRIRQALDNVAVAVTVSDQDNQLIYMNQEARRLFELLEPSIQSRHPDFQVDRLIGSGLSDHLDDPDLRAAYQRRLEQPEQYDTCIGECHLRLIASPVYDDQGTYQGRVTQWSDRTEELRLAEEDRVRIEAERKVAAENARIRSALDNVSSNVMLADAARRIIYMNKSATRLFQEIGDEVRQELPRFETDRLLGSCIDDFHAHPEHQASLLEKLTDTWESEIRLGERVMRIVANPVFDEAGQRLGTAVEWTDRTAEVAIENEIDGLIQAAGHGDLARRIALEDKEGFFRTLGQGFNRLLEQLSSVFNDIGQVMHRLAEGQLDQKIERHYEGVFGKVKDDVNSTIDNLSQVIHELREAAAKVAENANEIATGNNQLSARTEQQASNLEETASSMEELTSTVANNADNAQQANQLAGTARQSAEKGGVVVSEAVAAMHEIEASASQIGEIIGVIDEIAFQTNLLALNASVEAARAGEQGRGFAVVATEVRNLASRSADAAREIKELIENSLGKVSVGARLVNASGETLEEIVQGVKKVGDIIAEIAAASSEQTAGIAQVNHAVTEMDELTQQNAALAEQTSAASSAMMEKAAEMQRLIGFFRD